MSNFCLNMTVGLKEDSWIKPERMNLYRFNDVFFPENSYYNCDPLPQEWIEVVEEQISIFSPNESPVRLPIEGDGKREIQVVKQAPAVNIQIEG